MLPSLDSSTKMAGANAGENLPRPGSVVARDWAGMSWNYPARSPGFVRCPEPFVLGKTLWAKRSLTIKVQSRPRLLGEGTQSILGAGIRGGHLILYAPPC